VLILFDYQAFLDQRHGGVSRYAVELIRRLPAHPGVEVVVFAGLYRNDLLARLPRRPGLRIIGWHIPDKIPGRRRFGILNRVAFSIIIQLIRPDIYHATYYKTLAPRAPVRRVIMVFDMIHELGLLPNTKKDPTIARKRVAVEAADLVLCDSENTRQDLLRILNVSADKTVVTHLGCELIGTAQEAPPLDHPYILFVGERRYYKNAQLLWDAWKGSAFLRNHFNLVFFGGRTVDAEELRSASEPPLKGLIHFICGDDDKLATWYRHAFALVYPSRYEGFGIPPLEAMQHGCPVITTRCASIPEVVGDAALYVNADNPDDVATCVKNLFDQPGERESLIARGKNRLMSFTWTKCVDATLAAYRKTLEAPP